MFHEADLLSCDPRANVRLYLQERNRQQNEANRKKFGDAVYDNPGRFRAGVAVDLGTENVACNVRFFDEARDNVCVKLDEPNE